MDRTAAAPRAPDNADAQGQHAHLCGTGRCRVRQSMASILLPVNWSPRSFRSENVGGGLLGERSRSCAIWFGSRRQSHAERKTEEAIGLRSVRRSGPLTYREEKEAEDSRTPEAKRLQLRRGISSDPTQRGRTNSKSEASTKACSWETEPGTEKKNQLVTPRQQQGRQPCHACCGKMPSAPLCATLRREGIFGESARSWQARLKECQLSGPSFSIVLHA